MRPVTQDKGDVNRRQGHRRAMTESTPTHFTYQPFDPKDDLHQGDILEPTKNIHSIFKEVHPHFLDAKYNAFLVLTQTCDLVRRKEKKCKSRYINLAVVRPIGDILWSFLDKICQQAKVRDKSIEGVYIEKDRDRAKNFIRRVVNQNEQAFGLFYLHPDEAVNIYEDSVALLQVSIALRSQEHYDALVDARRGRLKPDFQAKLGWLIGNLFSRVATEDLTPKKCEEIVSQLLNPIDDTEHSPYWIPETNLKLAEKQKIDIEGLPRKQALDLLRQCQPKPPKDVAIEQTLFVIQEIVGPFSSNVLDKIKSRLSNDPVFLSVCK